MNTILYFSSNGPVYETRAYSKADIDRLFKGRQLHCLTSPDRQFDFWFSPLIARLPEPDQSASHRSSSGHDQFHRQVGAASARLRRRRHPRCGR